MVEAVSDGFGVVTLELSSEWLNALWGDRFAVQLQAQGTEYLSGLLGVDGNLLLNTSWQKSLSSKHSIRIEGLGWVFRRENMEDFDLNSLVATGRYTFAASRPILFSLGGRHQQLGFTDRFVTPDTTLTGGPGDVIVFPVGTDTETDHQSDIVASTVWRGRRLFASLEVAYRWAYSNEPLVEYKGPQGALRVGSRFPKSDVVAYMSGASRDFLEPYIFEDGTEVRRDRAIQLGLFADRALSPRMRVFVDGSWLRQHSEIEDFTFNQTQIQVGMKLSVVEPVSSLKDLLGFEPTLKTEGPIIFRFSDPDAGEVTLVGDFNGWNPGIHPMLKTTGDEWTVAVDLAPGIWRYALIVDGQWVTPPEAAQYEDDGFGGKNGVVIVQ